MEREVRYCTTDDGVRIAYCVEGEGPPLLWCPIFIESFSLTDRHPVYGPLLAELSQRRMVVRYDARGTGLSESEVSDFSCQALAMDIGAVANAAGLQLFATWANAMSGPRAIAYAASNVASVSHLVLYDTFTRAEDAFPIAAATSLADLARSNWKLAAQAIPELAARADIEDPAERQFRAEANVALGRIYEESAGGDVAAAMIQEPYESWDVSELLPRVRCPVLVVHHLGNPLFPIDVANETAAALPNATLVTLEGSSPSPVGDANFSGGSLLPPAIDRFLPGGAPDSGAVQSLAAEGHPRESPSTTNEESMSLTARETEVLSLLAGGYSGKEIAAELTVSLSTVQRHIANVYAKIGARGRVEAAAYAIRHGLVRPRDG